MSIGKVQKGLSSEEEFESSEKEEIDVDSGDGPVGLATLRTPSLILNGHTSVVICADWLYGEFNQGSFFTFLFSDRPVTNHFEQLSNS